MVHAVNFNQRFYPNNLHARAVVNAGEARLGPAHHRRLPAGLAALQHDWSWRLEPELGGDLRVIGDIGSHWLDLNELVHRTAASQAVMADLTIFMPTRPPPT